MDYSTLIPQNNHDALVEKRRREEHERFMKSTDLCDVVKRTYGVSLSTYRKVKAAFSKCDEDTKKYLCGLVFSISHHRYEECAYRVAKLYNMGVIKKTKNKSIKII